MNPLYFRITEPPAPEVFDPVWIEVPATRNPLVLGRDLWRSSEVSRNDERCATIRFDLQSEVWTIKNSTRDQIVILTNGTSRFDVLSTMSLDIGAGSWSGSLTHAFRFAITHHRPQGAIVVHGEPSPVPRVPGVPTKPRRLADLARGYLEKHRLKRLALAFMWREHLGPTPDLAADLDPAVVAVAFGESGKTITTWREELANHVYGERGHQHQIRDFVVKYRILTMADVLEATDWARRTSPRVPPPRPAPRDVPRFDSSTTRRPPSGR